MLPSPRTCKSFAVDIPVISPMPPVAAGAALPWDGPVDDAVAVIADARATCGETFVVDSGGDRYLFTFSPVGVTELYGLPEASASKGVADWRMLRRKVPDDLFSGRRTFPHDLFGRSDSANYMQNVRSALSETIEELGESGTVDVFDLTRRLGHRVGLASWGGPGSSSPPILDLLIAAFDTLDGSEAFVHPDVMAHVAETQKAEETEALRSATELISKALDHVDGDPDLRKDHPLFSRIADAWADEATRDETNRGGTRCGARAHRFYVQPFRSNGMGIGGPAGKSEATWRRSVTAIWSGRSSARWNPPGCLSGRSCRGMCSSR